MKTFTKYIIPILIITSLLICIATTIVNISKYVDTTTTDLVLAKAVNHAITFNIILVIFYLGVILYTINYIIYIYNKHKAKEDFKDIINKIFKEKDKKVVHKMDDDINSNIKKDTSINKYKSEYKFIKPADVFDHLKPLSNFPNIPSYVIYLSNQFKSWTQGFAWQDEQYASLLDKWADLFKLYKPQLKDYPSRDKFEAALTHWQSHLPLVLLDRINIYEDIIPNNEKEIKIE
jgi:hypothetical protein